MQSLFDQLSGFIDSGGWPAMTAALVWGIFSVILSPCHMAAIPLIIGYMGSQRQLTVRRAFVLSLSFSLAIGFTIAVIGLITHLAGRLLGDLGSWTQYIIAAVFLLFGLVLLDVIKLPWSSPAPIQTRHRGILGALILGLVFGLAVGPCTFAFMGPVLAVVLTGTIQGLIMLLLYGMGHCSVLILAGTCTQLIQTFLNWDNNSRISVLLRKLCGLLILLIGLWLLL